MKLFNLSLWFNGFPIKKAKQAIYDIQKMNDKGRKKILVKFTNVVCDYFIATVEYIGNHRKWLGFIFKIKDGELLLVQTHIYTIDI